MRGVAFLGDFFKDSIKNLEEKLPKLGIEDEDGFEFSRVGGD